ncbi:hypothetical protein DPMN_080912 [Dreissena polymorpha]|uniref:Uncharacterized protein n=1 Tax=Dreissena polymorpha TaxID=45954 RepID=A0A9D3Y7P2_DREPO|nr:hypothetical protein DPMN_080912 [Dreissena polymorpha]
MTSRGRLTSTSWTRHRFSLHCLLPDLTFSTVSNTPPKPFTHSASPIATTPLRALPERRKTPFLKWSPAWHQVINWKNQYQFNPRSGKTGLNACALKVVSERTQAKR